MPLLLLRFEHDVVVAQLAIAQVCANQQAIQGFFRGQGTAYSRRGNILSQFGWQADLPARHHGKGVKRGHQGLLGDCEFVIAHGAGSGLLITASHGRSCLHTGQKHGDGQQ